AESLGYRFAVAEAADHVSQLVDVEHPGVRGLGIVDDGELVALPQESMNVPRVSAVLVGAGVEAAAVASIHPRVGRFRGGVFGEDSAGRRSEGDGFQRFVVD